LALTSIPSAAAAGEVKAVCSIGPTCSGMIEVTENRCRKQNWTEKSSVRLVLEVSIMSGVLSSGSGPNPHWILRMAGEGTAP